MLSRWLPVALALAACKSPPRATDGDGGPPPPDVAIDGAELDAAPDATPDAPPDALVDVPPDAHVSYADPLGPLAAMPPLCSPDHWCWMAPRPHGNSYDHIFATAPDNLWMIGGKGLVLQWDGTAWHDRTPPPLPGSLRWELAWSIGGLAPNNMWLSIGTTLQHWDGTAWTIVDGGLPTSYSTGNLWVAPNGEVWCLMLGGATITHVLTDGTIQRVGGIPGSNIFGVATEDFWTTAGTSLVHVAAGQATIPYQGSAILGMITGTNIDDMWFGGEGTFVHYHGGTFTTFAPADTGLPQGAMLSVIDAKAPDDMTFLADHGTKWLVHWDGTALTKTEITIAFGSGSVIGRTVGDVTILAGSYGNLWRLEGTTASWVVNWNDWLLHPLWGRSANDMYWGSLDLAPKVSHWDGTQWTDLPVNASSLTGIDGSASPELFAVSTVPSVPGDASLRVATLSHFDGTAWTTITPEAAAPLAQVRQPWKVYALGPGEAIAIGGKGLAYRYSAGAWKPLVWNETEDLIGIWGPDADHAWITTPTKLLRWERTNPGVLTQDTSFTPNSDRLGPIHGAGGVWWIGVVNDAAIWKGTAAGWTRMYVPTIPYTIFAVSATDVVATSPNQASIARWNGTTWTSEDNNAWTATGQWLYRPPGGPMYAQSGNLVVTHP